MSVNRCLQPGWRRVGQLCSAGRRALWFRTRSLGTRRAYVELCAGREGDDEYMRMKSSNPKFAELLEILHSAEWAVELGEQRDLHARLDTLERVDEVHATAGARLPFQGVRERVDEEDTG